MQVLQASACFELDTMKIQLEHKLISCPEQLSCVVCQQQFYTPMIRSLLTNDQGLIQGDVCQACLRMPPDEIKHQLREQALQFITHRRSRSATALAAQEFALDLLRASNEPFRLPGWWPWLQIRLQALLSMPEESQLNNFKLSEAAWSQRSRLQMIFDQDSQP
jgi:hypothetical protein